MPVKDKLRFVDALIVSKLSYGLSTLCLATAQKRRLDGFHARCLRRILRIPAAYVSRVPNATVLSKAGVAPFSKLILRRQLLLLGRVACSPVGSPLRESTFIGSSLSPQVGRYVRRVGRPRQDWYSQVYKAGVQMYGKTTLEAALADMSLMRRLLN